MRRVALVAIALLITACGSSSGSGHESVGTTDETVTSSTAVPSSTSSSTVSTSTTIAPHFDTPEAAMRYLADAWNRDDIVSLKHVTDPSARAQLAAMHDVAVNLRLDHCDKRVAEGDYECTFTHDFPPNASTTVPMEDDHGTAAFIVGPADKPGWYMTVFEYCS